MAKQRQRAAGNRKWKVMVFMGTHTIVGNAPLVEAAEADLAEMASVRPSPHLEIFVQRHGDAVPTRRMLGQPAVPVPTDQREVADGSALKQFILWALGFARDSPVPPDPDARTMLVLWGHAYQFAIGHEVRDDGNVDALDVGELADTFTAFQSEVQKAMRQAGIERTPKLDILGFDACDIATVEMSCQLAPFADFLLASERGIPIPGWPYDRILDRLADPKGDRIMGPAELGAYAVRRYCEAYQSRRPVSLSLLDLRKADRLLALTDDLARRLALAFALDADERDLALDLMVASQTDTDKPFIDVADFCLGLMRRSANAGVRQAAEALGDFLISPAPVVPERSESGEGKPFIVEHARNAAGTARLNGVSLFAPHVALAVDPDDRATEVSLYQKFGFARASIWGQLVEGLAAGGPV
ncbi:MAG: clostripain-related cysteine peptidase [Vicinamibacterales bacterium]